MKSDPLGFSGDAVFDQRMKELDGAIASVPSSAKDYDREGKVERIAEEEGCTVDLATDTVLQCDLDSQRALDQFREMVEMLWTRFPFEGYTISRSSSGNFHARVYLLTPYAETERILLQCLLGSDLKREALNFYRARAGIVPNVLLFKRKHGGEPFETHNYQPPKSDPLEGDGLPF